MNPVSIKLTILTSLTGLVISSSAFAQSAPSCQPGKPLPAAKMVTQNLNPGYRDYFGRCHNIVTDMRQAFSRANTMVHFNKTRAVELLYTTLTNKLGYIPGGSDYENPNTMQAIRSAYLVATATMESTKEDQASLGTRLTNDVRYLVMAELYQIVFFAYERLDEPFYMSAFDSCSRYSCHDRAWEILPSAYYEGVGRLANRFLDVQEDIAPIQASDHVELKVSAAVTRAAQEILLNSVFRRGYSCTLSTLAMLESDIHAHLNCNGYAPTPWFINEVRNRMSNIRVNTRHCGW